MPSKGTKEDQFMAIMHFMTGMLQRRRQVRRAVPTVLPRAKGRVQAPDIKGLRALDGVTYITAHDANGRMDDDLFDMLCKDGALAS